MRHHTIIEYSLQLFTQDRKSISPSGQKDGKLGRRKTFHVFTLICVFSCSCEQQSLKTNSKICLAFDCGCKGERDSDKTVRSEGIRLLEKASAHRLTRAHPHKYKQSLTVRLRCSEPFSLSHHDTASYVVFSFWVSRTHRCRKASAVCLHRNPISKNVQCHRLQLHPGLWTKQ